MLRRWREKLSVLFVPLIDCSVFCFCFFIIDVTILSFRKMCVAWLVVVFFFPSFTSRRLHRSSGEQLGKGERQREKKKERRCSRGSNAEGRNMKQIQAQQEQEMCCISK
ncbi:hypothetical protein, unlikely [Trypanosoma brucei gambiense DAL972]|uniref:Uncharacterized protein n=1 Tax=Trypanosoma brucei gambiense (strain MHOM/CI/86/DAL972) TaxID=679716 RepID=D0A401_TRYB9|nr:hypothetical protein, unlikely [Trypanosoma brucei gambiense DAL972]CBH15995.1 hypothetical protein, unlikely [Trypanosoma brucei gambiense DAL972]|eukprot:XP_011778259.1 hypothetical protein, unlikely [Trypanosoma brucei gambiense DAL972]